ncbi:hypothetical protein Tco_1138605, partial [Tanacetum coccineum]
QYAILRVGILTDEAISSGTLSKSNEKRKAVEKTSKLGGSWWDKKKAKMGAVLLEDLADTSDTLYVHAGNPLCCDWLRNVAHNPMDEIDGYEAVWIEGTKLKEWRSVSGSRSFCSWL